MLDDPLCENHTNFICLLLEQVEQIQAEYKKLALELHPDKNSGNKEAEAKFQQLQVITEKFSVWFFVSEGMAGSNKKVGPTQNKDEQFSRIFFH